MRSLENGGVSTIWVGVFVHGTWYAHRPRVLVVIELEAQHKPERNETRDKGGQHA